MAATTSISVAATTPTRISAGKNGGRGIVLSNIAAPGAGTANWAWITFGGETSNAPIDGGVALIPQGQPIFLPAIYAQKTCDANCTSGTALVIAEII